jgi:signal transduction histidine kinase
MPRNARPAESSDHQALAELGLVSASVIHEVKNALQGIANALFLLEHDPTLKPGAREWISDAQRELSRAFAASRQTLALVRHESPSQVSVTRILDEVLEASSGKSAYKGIAVERRYEYDGTIEANESAIREVFTNLVLNALEAVPRREGKLTVRTSACNRSNGKDVAGVLIVFEDNGPGIPDAHKQKVFEPLFSTKKGTGTGLGLWVSERLVHQQHGALWLESKKNSHAPGSSFSMFLPLKQS